MPGQREIDIAVDPLAGPNPVATGPAKRVTLDRPRHAQLIDTVRGAGARIKLISDGDLSAAISCAVMGTGVHAVMGVGGAPEGVLSAVALRCLGGEIQGRIRWRSDEERDRAEGRGMDPSRD